MMKQSLLFIGLFLMLGMQVGAQKSVNTLFEDMKDDDRSFALKLPGWILNTGLKYALSGEDNETLNLFKDKIKQVRVLVNEHPTIDVKQLIANFTSKVAKDNLELYASVRSDGNIVNVYVEENKDRIRNLFFLINGNENVVLLHLKTDILLTDFQKANFTFNNKNKKDENKN